MNVAAALALQSIPFAGLLVADDETSDVMVVLCFVALGLILSAIGIVDDAHDFSAFFGVATDPG